MYSTLIDLLRSAFPHARDTSIAGLAEEYRSREATPGIVQDARSHEREVLIVLDGHIAVVQRAPDGRQAFLGVFGRGTVVGLLTLAGDADVVAIEALDAVVLGSWRTELIRDTARRDPGMLLDIVDHLVHGLRLALSLLEKQTFATASARLASFLLRHEDLVFSASPPRILRSQLAALVGVSREMSSRILRRWERAGIISRAARGRLVLVDRQRLEQEAAGADDLAPTPRLTSDIAS